MSLSVSISIGELLDKISILELKKNIITDENKLVEIEKEIQILIKYDYVKNTNLFYYNILKWINEQIWKFTDTIKASNVIDQKFAILSNKIFNYNQYRFRVKNILNSKSHIKEQKSYDSNNIKINVNFDSFYSNLTKINKLSILYDSVIFCTCDIELMKLISNIYSTSNFSFSGDYGQDIDQIILYDFDNVDVFNFIPINYISGGLLGDFIHHLSVCNEIFLKTGRKANIYITDKNINGYNLCSLDHKNPSILTLVLSMYDGFTFGAEKAHADLSIILNKQKYINLFAIHNGESCSINLSSWRNSSHLLYKVNWYHIFLENYNVDWAKHKWIYSDSSEEFKDVILLNVSMNRYVDIEYNRLLFSKKIIFICNNKSEYDNFSTRSNTAFSCYVVKDIEDMFKSIAGCYCFIGNLSSPLAFAISMHKYCVGLIGEITDTVHMEDLQIPNYYYYQNKNSFDKNIFGEI